MDENQTGQNSSSDLDSIPVSPLPGEDAQQSLGAARPRFDRTLWLTLGGIVLVSCCGILLVAYLFTRTSQFRQFASNPFSLPTPGPTPNFQATQSAWTRPTYSPTFGTAANAKAALDAGHTLYLENFATYFPMMPEINMPGDVYQYDIELNRTESLFWDYGWCTSTTQILDQNFAQMQVDFFLDKVRVPKEVMVSHDYSPSEGRYCRSFIVLVMYWPKGQHILESKVTFLSPTNDGWNLYPAGTHTFEYFVHVKN